MNTRAQGERIRARHEIERLEATLKGLRIALECNDEPIGFDAPQSLQITAGNLALTLARMDAYRRAEEDGKA